ARPGRNERPARFGKSSARSAPQSWRRSRRRKKSKVADKKFPYYPIFIDVENHDVVIIGGGAVCARKAETMLRYGANVTVVAPKFTEEIEGWAKEGRIRIKRKEYDDADLDGASIVIASTDDEGVNGRVARDSRRRKIPVNVVDVTHLCEFIVPAIVERGSIQLAVSTGGKSPALART